MFFVNILIEDIIKIFNETVQREVKKPDVVVHAPISTLERYRQENPLFSELSIHSKFKGSLRYIRPCLKEQGRKKGRKNARKEKRNRQSIFFSVPGFNLQHQ